MLKTLKTLLCSMMLTMVPALLLAEKGNKDAEAAVTGGVNYFVNLGFIFVEGILVIGLLQAAYKKVMGKSDSWDAVVKTGIATVIVASAHTIIAAIVG